MQRTLVSVCNTAYSRNQKHIYLYFHPRENLASLKGILLHLLHERL